MKKRRKSVVGWLYKEWFKGTVECKKNWISMPVVLPNKDKLHNTKVRITFEEV